MRTTSAVALVVAGAVVLVGTLVLVVAVGPLDGALLDGSDDPPGELEPLWTANTTTSVGGNHHQPAVTTVDGDRLVLVPLNGQDEDCRVAALDARGDPVWRHQVPSTNCHAHAVGDVAVRRFPGEEPSALVATGEERVLALALDDGATALAAELEEFGYSPPALLGNDTLVVTDFFGNVAAIGPDGTERWNHSIDAYVWARPLVASGPDGSDRIVIAGGSTGESGLVRGLQADGSEVWTTRFGRPVRSIDRTTIGGDRAVVAGSVDGTVAAVSSRDGATRWEHSVGGTARVAAVEDAVYAVDDRGTVRRLAPDDGATVWKRSTGEELEIPPSVGLADVGAGEPAPVLLAPNGQIRILDSADGSTLAVRQVDGRLLAPPTTKDLTGDGNDEIVVVTGDGRTLVFEFLPE